MSVTHSATDQLLPSAKMHPRIAVIVPIFNTAKYLPECFDSLLAQNYSNFTIFGIDDGSTDESGLILDQYAARYPCVVAKHQANSGVASARNLALQSIESDGGYDLICFVDSDDVVSANLLSLYAKGFNAYQAEFIAVGVEPFDRNGPVPQRNKSPHPPKLLTQDELFYFCFGFGTFKSSPASSRFIGNIAVSERIVQGLRFNPKQKIGEDQDFILHSLLRTHTGAAFADIAYRYRVRASSLSHNPTLRFDDLDRYIQWMQKELPDSCRNIIEFLAFDTWWQLLRRASETGKLHDHWDKFVSTYSFIRREFKTDELKRPSTRKRLWMFSLGRGFIHTYFKFSKKKKTTNSLLTAFE